MLLGQGVALAVLADESGGESKKAGPIGLLVILLLAVACYFLFRSMTRHLRRVRDGFPGRGSGSSPGSPGPGSASPGRSPEPAPPGSGSGSGISTSGPSSPESEPTS